MGPLNSSGGEAGEDRPYTPEKDLAFWEDMNRQAKAMENRWCFPYATVFVEPIEDTPSSSPLDDVAHIYFGEEVTEE